MKVNKCAVCKQPTKNKHGLCNRHESRLPENLAEKRANERLQKRLINAIFGGNDAGSN